eukprot:5633251-Pyramimonas_sp.AAC.1
MARMAVREGHARSPVSSTQCHSTSSPPAEERSEEKEIMGSAAVPPGTWRRARMPGTALWDRCRLRRDPPL